MTRLRMLVVRFFALFQRRKLERELETEIRSHLEMEAEDHLGRGLGPGEARTAARRGFGGVEQWKEHYRDLRGISAIETVLQDLRHGARMLARSPGFTFVAIVSLAVGVGANTATFSFADALLLRPLPVPRPGDVVTVGSTSVATLSSDDALRTSYPDYADVRDRSVSFDGLTASLIMPVQFAARAEATPEIRTAMLVSGNFFGVMDVEPALGRSFRAEEDQVPARDAVLVVSHRFWMRALGADPAVLGRRAHLNGIDFTLIGVAPEAFTGTDQWVQPDFYLPLMMWPSLAGDAPPDPLGQRDHRNLTLKGRLRDGVSLQQARADVASIGAALAEAYPVTNRNQGMFVRTELEDRVREGGLLGTSIAMLMMLAALVLFVACANVAGLLSSRAPARAGEIALRAAIGAGRRRLVRQLLTENVLLAAAGGLAGVGVGYLGLLLWRQLPVGLVFQIDGRVLAVNLAVAVLSVFLFGLAPAVQASRAGLTGALRSAGRSPAGRTGWGRRGLVMGQVALSLVLLAVAGFMYGSFLRQLAQGPGVRTDHVLTMSFDPGLSRYSQDQTLRFYDRLVARAREVTGVEAVALASFIPMSGDGLGRTPIRPEGHPFPSGTTSDSIPTSRVDPGFFDVMGIPLAQGRAFEVTDTAGTQRVAIVNQYLADRYWPTEGALGRRFRIGERDAGDEAWVEIVGVVPTGRYFNISESPTPFLYLPYAQHPQSRMALAALSSADPRGLVEPLRDVVRELDVGLAVMDARTMEDIYYDGTVRNFLVFLRAIAAMGVMGVTLAFVGLYGLVATDVSRRSREIGIRMAVGASQGTVLRMMLTQGLRPAVVGLAVGLVLAVGVSRAMVAAFPGGGGDQRGLLIWFEVTGAVLAITALAAYLPARRAARIDPTRALRCD